MLRTVFVPYYEEAGWIISMKDGNNKTTNIPGTTKYYELAPAAWQPVQCR